MKFLSKFRKAKNEAVKEVSVESRVYRSVNNHKHLVSIAIDGDTGSYIFQADGLISCGFLERVDNIGKEGK